MIQNKIIKLNLIYGSKSNNFTFRVELDLKLESNLNSN